MALEDSPAAGIVHRDINRKTHAPERPFVHDRLIKLLAFGWQNLWNRCSVRPRSQDDDLSNTKSGGDPGT